MSVQALLGDAVRSLHTAIKTKSGNATPEELAYLASAIEKIAGQLTLVDLIDTVDALKTELTNHKLSEYSDLEGRIDALMVEIQTQVTAMQNSFIATVNSTVTAQTNSFTTSVNSIRTTGVNDITSAKNIATNDINNTRNSASQTITDLKNAAVADVQSVITAANAAKTSLETSSAAALNDVGDLVKAVTNAQGASFFFNS